MMKKGVSTIVVVILLLLITISLIGFVFIFFTRSTSEAADQTTQQQQQLQGNLGKQLRIDNVAAQAITVRHTGTEDVLTSELSVFINDTAVSGETWEDTAGAGITTITTGTSAVVNLAAATPNSCATGGTIKITSPAGSVTQTC